MEGCIVLHRFTTRSDSGQVEIEFIISCHFYKSFRLTFLNPRFHPNSSVILNHSRGLARSCPRWTIPNLEMSYYNYDVKRTMGRAWVMSIGNAYGRREQCHFVVKKGTRRALAPVTPRQILSSTVQTRSDSSRERHFLNHTFV